MVRHRGRLGTVIQTVLSFGSFLFFYGGYVTNKGEESPGSRMGVIGAFVIFFHLRPSWINFSLPDRPSSALRH